MWLVLAFLSAALLGFYDVCKKYSLRGNAVLPILFLNTLFCSIIFLPMAFQTPFGGWEVQRYILLKACIVLSSWLLGYIGIKHLPITIVGPINATRPMLVLLGALLIFGERLNLWQWAGVMLAILSFCLLSRSGKKEGIDFRHNRWIFCIAGAAILGAISGLYDKYLMTTEGGLGLPRLTVQCWYNFYQAGIMGVMLLLLWWPGRKKSTPFQWRWSILLISIFLSLADYAYFYSLSLDGALISVVSMVRRSSVLVSFLLGALLFQEKNLQSKAIDLALVLLSMFLLWLGQ
ncbi:MAG: DMT family transporter [Bacteroidaceae bacterium]|mgnify:FL=1|jgi:drug/metabolite transporter (DMT)-like permease|nr:DMT family transporter [Bacteroidaceae bacterium]MBR4307442.1 DMT family transporter [Bacteroidaceae bacterium]MEE1308622.1 DMT family transporter [Bacteroidaceae bacterium]